MHKVGARTGAPFLRYRMYNNINHVKMFVLVGKGVSGAGQEICAPPSSQ